MRRDGSRHSSSESDGRLRFRRPLDRANALETWQGSSGQLVKLSDKEKRCAQLDW